MLCGEQIETESDSRTWITIPCNPKRLREIKGIKDKTAHYIEILLGLQNVAVDRHLFNFLHEAGIPTDNYADARQIICNAADHMKIPQSQA